MGYHCAKFGDYSFIRFGFIVRTDRQNHRITEAGNCYTHATTVGVSYGHQFSTLNSNTVFHIYNPMFAMNNDCLGAYSMSQK